MKMWNRNILKYVPLCLIAAGIILVLSAVSMKWYVNHRQEALVSEYDSAPVFIEAGQSSFSQDTGEGSNGAEAEIESFILQNAGDRDGIKPLCILSIPKIELKVAVVEGTDKDDLKYTVGHFEGTALPGQKGNCGITGHRNYVFGEFFNRLDELEPGDSIEVESNGRQFIYTVDDVLIVESEDTWVLDQTDDTRITLLTCTPLRIATHRLVVKGVLQ